MGAYALVDCLHGEALEGEIFLGGDSEESEEFREFVDGLGCVFMLVFLVFL